jgi:hypothetical protein
MIQKISDPRLLLEVKSIQTMIGKSGIRTEQWQIGGRSELVSIDEHGAIGSFL